MGNQITITVDDTELLRLMRATSGPGPVKIVADGVEYGIYQELGTSKMTAQAFMGPAVEAVRPGFNQAFSGVITNAQAAAVITKTAFDVERGAKQRAAVDTGAMRSSIHVVEGATSEFQVDV